MKYYQAFNQKSLRWKNKLLMDLFFFKLQSLLFIDKNNFCKNSIFFHLISKRMRRLLRNLNTTFYSKTYDIIRIITYLGVCALSRIEVSIQTYSFLKLGFFWILFFHLNNHHIQSINNSEDQKEKRSSLKLFF